MIATIAAAISLAGAPNVPVTCSPTPLIGGETGSAAGLTYLNPPRIFVVAPICGGLLLLSVDPQMRKRIARLNPMVNVRQWMGESALVILHEATHAAMNSLDEAAVECKAITLVPQFLARYLSGLDYTVALSWAQWYHNNLPNDYRIGC